MESLQVQEPKGREEPTQEGQEPCQEEEQEQEWGQGRRRRQEEPLLQEHEQGEQGAQESVSKAQRVTISSLFSPVNAVQIYPS